MFDNDAFDAHEKVLHVHDQDSGLKAIIAIHSTVMGPSAGGCRLWSYESAHEALTDALKLSKGMSYKNALAGLKLGGGKSVILGPVPDDARESLLLAFGECVEMLGGRYITAEDVGIGPADMHVVAKRTDYVSGLSPEDGVGGDPSPFTAYGIRRGIEAVAHQVFERADLDGLKVAVQGLGGVGGNLCRELSEQGAELLVADIDQDNVDRICDTYQAEPRHHEEILLAETDILAPCARGGAVTEFVAENMRARAVAGGANNQLLTERAGYNLQERGIAYAPDYVINAGGIIAVATEYFRDRSLEEMMELIDAIHDRTVDILRRVEATGDPGFLIADQMARDVIFAKRQAA